jgi:hypothetical protein
VSCSVPVWPSIVEALMCGHSSGVSQFLYLGDLLDEEEFWETELCAANKDRLFACHIAGINSDDSKLVNGVILTCLRVDLAKQCCRINRLSVICYILRIRADCLQRMHTPLLGRSR